MTAGGYGPLRATDADRDSVHSLLQAAYADGRLTWDEFDSRSSALLTAKTFNELAALTADLSRPVPAPLPVSFRPAPGVRQQTNHAAIASLSCGIGQLIFWLPASIAAIICGHVARSQIRRSGEPGAGMALAGLTLGYVGIVLPILIVVIAVLASS